MALDEQGPTWKFTQYVPSWSHPTPVFMLPRLIPPPIPGVSETREMWKTSQKVSSSSALLGPSEDFCPHADCAT